MIIWNVSKDIHTFIESVIAPLTEFRVPGKCLLGFFCLCHGISKTARGWQDLPNYTRHVYPGVPLHISVCGGNINTGKRDHIQSRVTEFCDEDAVLPSGQRVTPHFASPIGFGYLRPLSELSSRSLTDTLAKTLSSQASDYDCIQICIRRNRKTVLDNKAGDPFRVAQRGGVVALQGRRHIYRHNRHLIYIQHFRGVVKCQMRTLTFTRKALKLTGHNNNSLEWRK